MSDVQDHKSIAAHHQNIFSHEPRVTPPIQCGVQTVSFAWFDGQMNIVSEFLFGSGSVVQV